MISRDYYEVLNVDRTASQEEVKQAYRRLAREHHPDVRKDDPHAEDRFKEINEAYYVLSDPERRGQYDRFGRVGEMPDFSNFASPFDDLLSVFFGERGRGVREREDRPTRGADLRYDLDVSLEEAAAGVERTITFTRRETCAACFGTGRERGATPETCPTCRGSGQMRYNQQTVFGTFTQVVTCRQCGGRGTIVRNPCVECRGSGRQDAAHELMVKVPAGIDSGQQLRLSNEGEAGRHGGARGDLYVVVDVRAHPVFTREGASLFSEFSITMLQAVLGDQIVVPGLVGPITVAIPPGTQPGARLRLRGEGMPVLGAGGGKGDLYVRLRVEIPRDLNPAQRKALLQLADLRGEKVIPQKRSLWTKMKDLLQ